MVLQVWKLPLGAVQMSYYHALGDICATVSLLGFERHLFSPKWQVLVLYARRMQGVEQDSDCRSCSSL